MSDTRIYFLNINIGLLNHSKKVTNYNFKNLKISTLHSYYISFFLTHTIIINYAIFSLLGACHMNPAHLVFKVTGTNL